jgi:4-amino-4-deoxy-L-arabinose transferase-like glycosyltransferase
VRKYPRNLLYPLLFLACYLVINLFTIKLFPFIHSDETWLSGLSRNMIENKSLSATEPFFDLFPRTPHAVKSIFHSIQIVFINMFGYGISTVRMVSVFFSGISIILFYNILNKTTLGKVNKLILSAAFMCNIQFIYASRFARQEAVMLMMFLLLFNVLLSNLNKKYLLLSFSLIIAIGIHPNSFILAISIGLCFLYLVYSKEESLKSLVKLMAITGLGASFYIGISYVWNINFISAYSEYGSTLGVDNSILTKLYGIILFYKKLYLQIGATYYLPDIKLFLILGAVIVTISVVALFYNYKNSEYPTDDYNVKILSLLMILGVNIGIIIIGRYNQTSVIFMVPFILILLGSLLMKSNDKYAYIILSIFLIITINSSYKNITAVNYESYDSYIENISKYVSPTDKVLCNLNVEFYFDNGNLLDYRNLSYLSKENLTFRDYIRNNGIEYIVYPEEMDYIHRNIDTWWIMYGKMDYYGDMQEFIKNDATLIGTFESPSYGMRIVPFMNDFPWYVNIYKVSH